MTHLLLPDDAALIARHLLALARGSANRRPAAKATVELRARQLKHASQHLPWGLREADEDDIVNYLAPYRVPGREWTLATYDLSMRVFYAWGVAVGALSGNPMANLGRPAPGKRVAHPCTDEELAIALTAPQWPWRRAVLLAAYGGLRCAELCAAKVEHIIDGSWLEVTGKGGKTRVVPLAQPILDDIAEFGPSSGHLVLGARGEPRRPRVLTAMQQPIWNRLGLRQGEQDDPITLHHFRHWYATRMAQAGADLRTVQELLGHSSVATTQIYTQVTDARRVAAVAALPQVGLSQVLTGSTTTHAA